MLPHPLPWPEGHETRELLRRRELAAARLLTFTNGGVDDVLLDWDTVAVVVG